MAQMTQILNDLRERYGELRGLERRSDDLLKQVIDRFYVVEGINRLQTELDCLDLMVKNKANRTATGASDFALSSGDLTKSHSRLDMVKTFVHRSKRATKSVFSFFKLPLKYETTSNKIAGDELRKITRQQRANLSELMTTVRSTIVTNYGVLEQLQLLYEMHDKNMELWRNIRRLAETILPASQIIELVDTAVEQKCEIDDVAMGEGIIVGKASKESVKLVQQSESVRHTVSNEVSSATCNEICCTEVLFENKSATDGAGGAGEGVSGNVGDIAIGDGQTLINPNMMTQTLTDVKTTNSSETLCAATAADIDVPKTVQTIKRNLKPRTSRSHFSGVL